MDHAHDPFDSTGTISAGLYFQVHKNGFVGESLDFFEVFCPYLFEPFLFLGGFHAIHTKGIPVGLRFVFL
jgi:hypothetical protein